MNKKYLGIGALLVITIAVLVMLAAPFFSANQAAQPPRFAAPKAADGASGGTPNAANVTAGGPGNQKEIAHELAKLEKKIMNGEVNPYKAAYELLEKYFKGSEIAR